MRENSRSRRRARPRSARPASATADERFRPAARAGLARAATAGTWRCTAARRLAQGYFSLNREPAALAFAERIWGSAAPLSKQRATRRGERMYSQVVMPSGQPAALGGGRADRPRCVPRCGVLARILPESRPPAAPARSRGAARPPIPAPASRGSRRAPGVARVRYDRARGSQTVSVASPNFYRESFRHDFVIATALPPRRA